MEIGELVVAVALKELGFATEAEGAILFLPSLAAQANSLLAVITDHADIFALPHQKMLSYVSNVAVIIDFPEKGYLARKMLECLEFHHRAMGVDDPETFWQEAMVTFDDWQK